MSEILQTILIFALGAICPILDVHSTMKAMENPKAYESNKRFRNADWTTNIPKLILWKSVYFGVAAIISIILLIYGSGVLPIALFFFIASLIVLPSIIKNYKIAREGL